MGRKGIETMVGLFVLLGLLAVVFLALKAANLASFRVGNTYAVTAKFDNIGGLKVRAPVKSAGVTVGRVTAIALDTKSYQGTVTIELEQGLEFPADTSAKILTAGLLSIMAIYPYTLKAQRDAELLSEAVGLAQMKVEEIRRDDTQAHAMVTAIQGMATPSDPIPFPNEPRLTYSFCGETVMYRDIDPQDYRAVTGVARVIIRYAQSFRASQDAIYELRFQ
jgi:outer membrane lipid asymmetry maintenance protein MlaD